MKTTLWVSGLILGFWFGMTPTTVSYVSPPDPLPVVHQPVTFVSPLLKRICSCESMQGPNGTPQQFNADGTVIYGKVNPQDTGACQINLTYHKAEAERLGFDLLTWDGNVGFANWLYTQEGSTPWNWSKSCWG